MVPVAGVEGEEGAEVVEAEGVADREVEVAVKEGGGQEAGEGEDAEVEEEEEAVSVMLHGLGQRPKTLPETTSHLPGWHTRSSTSSRIKPYRKIKEISCLSEVSSTAPWEQVGNGGC